MQLPLKRNEISCYETVLSTEVCQEETFETIVPDACPDIERVLETSARAQMTSKVAKDGMAVISGQICATVLYLPEGGQGVCHVTVKIPFDMQLACQALTTKGEIRACLRVKCAQARALNPRKMLVRAEVIADLQCFEPENLCLCCEVDDSENGMQTLPAERMLFRTTNLAEKPFTFEEMLRFPSGYELLTTRGHAACSEMKLIGNKLVFKGNVEMQFLLCGQAGELEVARHQLPFSQIIEMEQVGQDAISDVAVEITDLEILSFDASSGEMEVRLQLLAQALVRCHCMVKYIQDVYSTACEAEVESTLYSMPELVDWTSRPQNIRELVETGAAVRQVIDGWVSYSKLDQQRQGEQIVLSCEVLLQVIYLDDNGQVQSVSRKTPVALRLDAPSGATCNASIKTVGECYFTATAGGIEVRLVAEIQSLLVMQTKVPAVSGCTLGQQRKRAQGDSASVILRLAAPNETLWDIAKSYGTTAQEIVKANELEEGNLPHGKMLLIPCTR